MITVGTLHITMPQIKENAIKGVGWVGVKISKSCISESILEHLSVISSMQSEQF